MKRTLKVVLTKDVQRLGQVGDIRNVAFGYAKNFLLPQKLAIPATNDAITKASERNKKSAAQTATHLEQQAKLREQIGTVSLTLRRKANKEGKLYGSVRPEDIADELRKAGLKGITTEMIGAAPLETIGTHSITVTLGGERSSFSLKVEPQVASS